jgi:methionyl-tRNA synthetase
MAPEQKPAPTGPTYYVTTSIPYVNARPHLGHAMEFVLTDVLARYHRLRGDDVWFLTGTDENSLKNVQAAEREGVPVQELVDRNADAYDDLRGRLELSTDDFIRTSRDPRHLDGVRALWEACDRNGDIYRGIYRGLYCVGCEQFYTEEELVDGLCPEHLTPPEAVEEENYFFRLSRYGNRLADLIASDRLRILPLSRKNEVLSFIRRGLSDFSISRSLARARGWGIPVPGDPGQVIYVWFDALANYITALGYGAGGALYKHYWLGGDRRVHVIGKGIVRFHAVYWPAMLLSASAPLPTELLVHGYVTINGEKISKSRGNTVDPVALAADYGADALRYFVLGQLPSGEDGDFTLERFVNAYNSKLANQLGNLLSRAVPMVTTYYDGLVPAPQGWTAAEERLASLAQGLPARYAAAMDRFAPGDAVAAVLELVGEANDYVVKIAPWALAGQRTGSAEAETRLATCLYTLVEALRLAAYYLRPFIPAAAAAIEGQLGLVPGASLAWDEATRWASYPSGTRLRPGPALFPRHQVPKKGGKPS